MPLLRRTVIQSMARTAVRRPTVIVVMNRLDAGGAEVACIEVVRALSPSCDLRVVSLLDGGAAAEKIRALGTKVSLLGGGGILRTLQAVYRLGRMFHAERPHVVITFLYLADLIGGVLARIAAPGAEVHWNVRNNVLYRRQTGFLTFAASRINGLVSRIVPASIVYCSELSRRQHESIGYRRRDATVVENSTSGVAFGFDPGLRDAFRRDQFAAAFVFLFVGRFDPVKRVDLFIEAGAAVAKAYGEAAQFVLAGRGMEARNGELAALVAKTGVGQQFHLLGHVSDPQRLYCGADCLVLTSESEGSPNVVFEAMATRLETIIFGTPGTEHIEGPGVTRLNGRKLGDLVRSMCELVGRGPTEVRVRLSGDKTTCRTAEHPLATHYRGMLSRS